MQLKTLVKVSSITNLDDARFCAGMGVAMMGFSLDKGTPRYVNPEQFKAICQWIKGVALVGELSGTNPAIIRYILDQYVLDYLQLNHPVALSHIENLSVPVVLKLNLQSNEKLPALQTLMATYAPYVKYFLLDTALLHEDVINSLQPTINRLTNRFSILQGYHMATKSLPHLLNTRLRGISLQWGAGAKPSGKDFDLLADVLERLSLV